MLLKEDFIRYSLEINLFFLRLAKEHSIFAAASLTQRDIRVADELIRLKSSIEVILNNAVKLSQGVISSEVLASGELVTGLTLAAEDKTRFYTGIPIDTNITKMELALKPGKSPMNNSVLFESVSSLNQQAIIALTTAIESTEKLMANVLSCNTFTFLYPLLIDHVIEETRFFTSLLIKLQHMEDLNIINKALAEEFKFDWNEIMKEHSQFIRGMLDPSETRLFETADAFAKEFARLEGGTAETSKQPIHSSDNIRRALTATTNLRNFKRAGTEGILACKIKSIILPLLADHVTREANHYLRLLKSLNTKPSK
ncbi:DUF2935 domain-containing protein [Clostridium oryzae]|uniref:DUF2935 domain-containing protein n=1 Tax=Clostridium oryzae TaxID=1450648 RepID=A0A1V4I5G9_9CLOT|nr:DUF2935 domain-containing protein [Clostridium oryzae]OPJ55212.1 hypothetical protein CLORY_44500 [Clostridium oryzae]